VRDEPSGGVDHQPEQYAEDQKTCHGQEGRAVVAEALDQIAEGEGGDEASGLVAVFIAPVTAPAYSPPMSRQTAKTVGCWKVIPP
jgi:hypothetical protein